MYIHLLHLFTKKVKHIFNVKCNSRVYSLAFKVNCPHDVYLVLPGETCKTNSILNSLWIIQAELPIYGANAFLFYRHLVSCARYPWVERVHKYCEATCPRLQCYLEDLKNNPWKRHYFMHSVIAYRLYCKVHATYFTNNSISKKINFRHQRRVQSGLRENMYENMCTVQIGLSEFLKVHYH